jgi:hypothetical protein
MSTPSLATPAKAPATLWDVESCARLALAALANPALNDAEAVVLASAMGTLAAGSAAELAAAGARFWPWAGRRPLPRRAR